MLHLIIVEDELHSRETLRNLVQEYCPDIATVALAASVAEGIAAIKRQPPDLIFLDIEMQTGTGFDLLEKVSSLDFEVIFITAYEHYALKAIKFSAIDYLLKPVDVDELTEAVEKVRRKKNHAMHNKRLEILIENLQNQNNNQHTLTLSTLQGLEFIRIDNIIRCEAMGAYTRFYLKDGRRIMVSKHLKEYENLLSEYQFFRIHQSHLVNLSEVERFIKKDGGHVVLKDHSILKVASNRKEHFLNRMHSH